MPTGTLHTLCRFCDFIKITLGLLILSINAFAEPIKPLTADSTANVDEVMLGKLLFNSPLLSADNTISCASCHDITQGGDDGLATSVGINNQIGPINAPTVLNSGLNFAQFWDGRSATLEEQTEGPIHNAVEMGSNWQQVINKLNANKSIVQMFADVYQAPINKHNIASAIAAYEKQLITLNAPFDRFLQGDETAISQSAKEGYELFKGMGCVSCHQGKNVGGNMYQHFGIMGNYFEDRGSIQRVDLGVYNRTLKEKDKFKFKVPSLRNIEKTAPYFHDGSAKTLEDAIRIMARYQLGRPISDTQIIKLKAFLVSLNGDVKEDLL